MPKNLWFCIKMIFLFLCSQAISRPSKSLSTAQLVHASCGSQASVISNIVLMKGQGKVRLTLLVYHRVLLHFTHVICKVQGSNFRYQSCQE